MKGRTVYFLGVFGEKIFIQWFCMPNRTRKSSVFFEFYCFNSNARRRTCQWTCFYSSLRFICWHFSFSCSRCAVIFIVARVVRMVRQIVNLLCIFGNVYWLNFFHFNKWYQGYLQWKSFCFIFLFPFSVSLFL